MPALEEAANIQLEQNSPQTGGSRNKSLTEEVSLCEGLGRVNWGRNTTAHCTPDGERVDLPVRRSLLRRSTPSAADDMLIFHGVEIAR